MIHLKVFERENEVTVTQYFDRRSPSPEEDTSPVIKIPIYREFISRLCDRGYVDEVGNEIKRFEFHRLLDHNKLTLVARL